MKLKPGFILRVIAGQNIVLSSGDNGNLNQMISLNDTGLFIWQQLQTDTTEEQIASALMTRYGINPELASSTTAGFIQKLREYQFIEE